MAWSKKQKPEIVFITLIPPRRKLELTIWYIASEDSILSHQLNYGIPGVKYISSTGSFWKLWSAAAVCEAKVTLNLMNWLIRKKMITYFYDKFSPVNRMHYIKCGVNISLHNSGCCRRSVAPWITVLSWHILFTNRVIYKFTFVWYSSKQGTMHRPTSHLAHLYIVPFLWPQEEHTQQRSCIDDFACQCLLWQLSSRKTFVATALGLPINLGVGDLGSFQLPQSNSSPEGAWNLVGYI